MQCWLLNMGSKFYSFTTDINGYFWCSFVSKSTEEQGIKNTWVSKIYDLHSLTMITTVHVDTAAVK